MGLFDRSLDVLIRSLRNMTGSDLSYISQCTDKIRTELRQGNMSVKANAVTKLLYLQMHGWECSWAAFHIIEVMSSMKYSFKRIGYLVASQSFHKDLEVLVLSTNTIKRDINSQNMYEAGIAMSALSNFVTPSIAGYLSSDIIILSNSAKPYLRKRGILLMYHVCTNFRKSTEHILPRLAERLEDYDPGVQLTAVNVIFELARGDPKSYICLVPTMLNIMRNAPNNWMLIKIIKLFCVLMPVESRLDRKFMSCLTTLIHSTTAMSLLYECLNAALICMPSCTSYKSMSNLCVERLRFFIQSPDKNLKYLGLQTMSKILKSHHNSVEIHRDLVLECLEDRDHSIKHRALDLLQGMVSVKNLRYVVERLVAHMEQSPGACYRDVVIEKIIEICSQDNYIHMNKFEWYICISIDLTKKKGTKRGHLISHQLIDICLRFENVRGFVVSKMAILVENGDFLYRTSERTNIYEVLHAAFWICGEHAELLKKPQRTLEIMLNSPIMDLPPKIQMLCAQSVFKIHACIIREVENANDFSLAMSIEKNFKNKLKIFDQSDDLEVQERISCFKNLVKISIKYHSKNVKISEDLLYFREEKITPVDKQAQGRVSIPDGLDLDLRISESIRRHHLLDKEENSKRLKKKNKPCKKLSDIRKWNKGRKLKKPCSSMQRVRDYKEGEVTEPLLLFEDGHVIHQKNGRGEKEDVLDLPYSFI